MKKLLFFFCLVAFALVSCKSSKTIVPLTGVKWVALTIDGKKLQLKETTNEVSIQFNEAEKRVNGLAGCNRFFGGYEVDGNKLKFSHMGATRMACPDMDIEQVFFKVLEDTDSYSIKDNKLSLLQKEKVLAVFETVEGKQQPKK